MVCAVVPILQFFKHMCVTQLSEWRELGPTPQAFLPKL